MPKEIILDIKPKENKIKVYLPWIIASCALAAIFFASGYGVGRYTDASLPFFKKTGATESATRKGWYVYEDAKFSFEYPKGWEVKTDSGEEKGTKVTGDGGEIRFWLDTIRPFKFTLEQTKNQEKSKVTNLKIDGRSAEVTEYPYKDGSSFTVIEVPKTEKKEKVAFWLNAAGNSFKKILFEILSTFKTNSVAGKISRTNE